jgi:hypothetical protein
LSSSFRERKAPFSSRYSGDVLRHGAADPGHVGEERGGGGVHLHADPVHAALHRLVEAPLQLRLRDVVLVLPHPDRLRIDLDQLGERVLQAPGDGDGGAEGEIELGELLARHVGRRVDRGTRLVDHDHRGACAGGDLPHRLAGEPVRLARGGTVPDRDELDAVLLHQRPQLPLRPVLLVEVDDAGGEERAGPGDDGELAPGAIARVDPQGHASTRG